MALKKPSELFGKKGDNSKISENINGNLNNIKQQFDKVEELKREFSDIEKKLADLLDEYVRPAVEQDGGFISLKKFDKGTVTVSLQGACSGCPSSSMPSGRFRRLCSPRACEGPKVQGNDAMSAMGGEAQ